MLLRFCRKMVVADAFKKLKAGTAWKDHRS